MSWHAFGTMVPALPELGWWRFWFLVDLLAYAPITFWLFRADQAHAIFTRIDRWVARDRPSVTLIILAGGVAAAMGVLLVARLAGMAGGLAEPVWAAHQILGYAPLYAFGVILAGSPALFRHMTARTGPAFTVLAMVFALCLASRLLPGGGKGLFDGPASLLNVVTSCLFPPAVTVLILRSAISFR